MDLFLSEFSSFLEDSNSCYHMENESLFYMIERAENWLRTNTYTTTILKWKTDEWGEIPADFGRK